MVDEIDIWIYGLIPFTKICAHSLKSSLIQIYAVHLIPLTQSCPKLIPSLILALLPLIEEEDSEYFELVVEHLDKFASSITRPIFYNHLWDCMTNCNAARLPGLIYLSRRLPKFSNAEDFMCNHPPKTHQTVLKCFAALLFDPVVLVNRLALTMLCNTFPLSSCIGLFDNLKSLVANVISVILRRESSLNRRVFEWIGHSPDISMSTPEAMGIGISIYTKSFTTSCFELEDQLIRHISILTSLMDYPKIGLEVLRSTFWLMLEAVSSMRGNHDVLA